MAVRSTLASWFADANAEALESTIRHLAERVMEQRSAPDTDVSDRITALEADNAKLKKKLDMAMGAIQASTAQLMAVKRELSQSQQTSRQAMQAATSALATAESAVEGVTDLEAKL